MMSLALQSSKTGKLMKLCLNIANIQKWSNTSPQFVEKMLKVYTQCLLINNLMLVKLLDILCTKTWCISLSDQLIEFVVLGLLWFLLIEKMVVLWLCLDLIYKENFLNMDILTGTKKEEWIRLITELRIYPKDWSMFT